MTVCLIEATLHAWSTSLPLSLDFSFAGKECFFKRVYLPGLRLKVWCNLGCSLLSEKVEVSLLGLVIEFHELNFARYWRVSRNSERSISGPHYGYWTAEFWSDMGRGRNWFRS